MVERHLFGSCTGIRHSDELRPWSWIGRAGLVSGPVSNRAWFRAHLESPARLSARVVNIGTRTHRLAHSGSRRVRDCPCVTAGARRGSPGSPGSTRRPDAQSAQFRVVPISHIMSSYGNAAQAANRNSGPLLYTSLIEYKPQRLIDGPYAVWAHESFGATAGRWKAGSWPTRRNVDKADPRVVAATAIAARGRL